MDEDLRYCYFSDRFEEITGIPPQHLLGKRREETGISGVEAEIWEQQLEDLAHHRAFEEFIVPRQQPDGSWRYFSNSGQPYYDQNGIFKGFRGSGRDVTPQKEAEAQLRRSEMMLRTVLDAVPATISAKGLDFRYLFVNKFQAENLFGSTPDEVVGKTFGEMLGFDAGTIADRLDQKVVETGQPLINHEEQIPDHEGIPLTVLTTKVPLLDDENKVAGVVTVALDISDRKQAELELRDSRKRAEEANRAKSDFLASMSHDLRTPLNAILGFSEVLQLKTFGALGNPKYVEYADLIHQSGRQLLILIDDILDLSKIESGEYRIEPHPMDLEEISSYVMKVFAPDLTGRKLSLAGEFSKIRGIRLNADPKSMNQILNNLVSNAVRFTPDGGSVQVIWELDGEGCCLLKVIDTGCGISEQDLEHLTQPFYQASAHISREEKGTGLGLYICRRLAELHGGNLTITSTPGEGTEVCVRFPKSRVMPQSG